MKREIIKGIRDPRLAARYLRKKGPEAVRLTTFSCLPIGENIFDQNWDLLIILDSCRIDVLKEIANKYNYLNENEIESMISTGSSTLEWSAATFINGYKDKIQNTALISANPWPYRIIEEQYKINHLSLRSWDTVSPGTLGLHKCAWKYEKRAIDERTYGDSSIVTDLAIQAGREKEHERVIAHYIEPHFPYVAAAQSRGANELSETEQKPWSYLKNGGDRDAVWENYLTELKAGLNEVSVLLENFDAESVLITADHGEAFGEYWRYGHPSGSLHPKVRWVPKVETSATDDKTRDPNRSEVDEEVKAEDRLRQLGYLK